MISFFRRALRPWEGKLLIGGMLLLTVGGPFIGASVWLGVMCLIALLLMMISADWQDRLKAREEELDRRERGLGQPVYRLPEAQDFEQRVTVVAPALPAPHRESASDRPCSERP